MCACVCVCGHLFVGGWPTGSSQVWQKAASLRHQFSKARPLPKDSTTRWDRRRRSSEFLLNYNIWLNFYFIKTSELTCLCLIHSIQTTSSNIVKYGAISGENVLWQYLIKYYNLFFIVWHKMYILKMSIHVHYIYSNVNVEYLKMKHAI